MKPQCHTAAAVNSQTMKIAPSIMIYPLLVHPYPTKVFDINYCTAAMIYHTVIFKNLIMDITISSSSYTTHDVADAAVACTHYRPFVNLPCVVVNSYSTKSPSLSNWRITAVPSLFIGRHHCEITCPVSWFMYPRFDRGIMDTPAHLC